MVRRVLRAADGSVSESREPQPRDLLRRLARPLMLGGSTDPRVTARIGLHLQAVTVRSRFMLRSLWFASGRRLQASLRVARAVLLRRVAAVTEADTPAEAGSTAEVVAEAARTAEAATAKDFQVFFPRARTGSHGYGPVFFSTTS
jgi:hypothetical protein